MTTITLQVPKAELNLFKQVAKKMGWVLKNITHADSSIDEETQITPELRKKLDQTRTDLDNGELTVFANADEAKRWMESL